MVPSMLLVVREEALHFGVPIQKGARVPRFLLLRGHFLVLL